jgi:hypothetical protein
MFSDSDLAKLKTMVLNCEAFYGLNQIPLRLSDLLARLDAAEDALAKATPFFDMNPTRIGDVTHTGTHVFTDAYWAWKKSAGKAEGK